MTLRRYQPMKKSAGTQIPSKLRAQVKARDGGCLGPRIGMPGPCFGGLEIDHVRASGGIGMKSPTTLENTVQLCSTHHRYKTEHGREVRPLLLAYIEEREGAATLTEKGADKP